MLQNMITILGSIVNITGGGGLHDEHKNLRFDMNKVFIYTSLQTMRKVAIDLIRIC